MCPETRKHLWTMTKAEKVFLAIVMVLSAGPAGTADAHGSTVQLSYHYSRH